MYTVETTDVIGGLIELINQPTIWANRGNHISHLDASREALRLRDMSRTDRPTVRVRGIAGDDKGKTVYVSQRLLYRNEIPKRRRDV